VPAGSTFEYYVAEVWAQCPKLSKVAQWWLEVINLQNGKLELYVGNAKTPVKQRLDYAGMQSEWTRMFINSEKARVRALFYPSDKAVRSHAKIWLEAFEADKGAEACMDIKDCLSALGDGSAASYKLRNDNNIQYKCLRGTNYWSSMERGVRGQCEKWYRCLLKSGKKTQIRAILGAAMKTRITPRRWRRPSRRRNGLLQGAHSTNETRMQLCVDPSVDDLESMDCECAESMMKTCSGAAYASQDLETCMNSLMCKNPNVCPGWKRTHCTVGSLMAERSQASNKVATNGKVLNHLDGTIQGKCAE
jgi:hypothetical protein